MPPMRPMILKINRIASNAIKRLPVRYSLNSFSATTSSFIILYASVDRFQEYVLERLFFQGALMDHEAAPGQFLRNVVPDVGTRLEHRTSVIIRGLRDAGVRQAGHGAGDRDVDLHRIVLMQVPK